jgi:hypothetical protein
MPVKTPAKKTKSAQKPVKKTAGKAPKKVTWDDIEAGFKRLQKSQDEAWKAIRETQQAHKETEKALKEARKKSEKALIETREESEKALMEARKESEKTLTEARKKAEKAKDEAWKAIRETQKNIGGLNNTLGSLVEHIMTPGLPQKFKKLGYSFNRIVTYKFAEGVHAQIDGMLENGEQAVAVEVKTTLRQSDIDDHIERMEKIRKYADEHGDKRQFMGAMAATITDKSTKDYALKNGLFVIEPLGEDVKVTKPETEPRVKRLYTPTCILAKKP